MLAGGYWIGTLHGTLAGLYWIVAASYVLFGGINLFAMASGLAWGRRLPALATAHDKKVAVG